MHAVSFADVEIWANQGQGTDKEMNIVADGWKAVGAHVIPFTIPAARLGDREFESTHDFFRWDREVAAPSQGGIR